MSAHSAKYAPRFVGCLTCFWGHTSYEAARACADAGQYDSGGVKGPDRFSTTAMVLVRNATPTGGGFKQPPGKLAVSRGRRGSIAGGRPSRPKSSLAKPAKGR